MPLLDYIQSEDNLQLATWDLQESKVALEKLYNLAEDNNYQILTEKRQIEYLGKKLCLQHLGISNALAYDTNGKPFLQNSNQNISISHSGSKVSVAISYKEMGLDIQAYQNKKMLGISKKFIALEEERWLCKKKNVENYLHLIWGAKESIYKIKGKSAVRFSHHLQVAAFEYNDNYESSFSCWFVEKSVFTRYTAHYKMLDNYFLVWVHENG